MGGRQFARDFAPRAIAGGISRGRGVRWWGFAAEKRCAMNLMVVTAVVSAWLLGVALIASLWPQARSLRDDAVLVLSAGAALGLGVTAVIFFAASLVSNHPARLGG